MNTVASTTFEDSTVSRATKPLPELTYLQAVKRLVPYGPVEACSRYHGRLLKEVDTHPVVAAIHHAFMDHRPLCLSPDTIWLMIIQGVATHINAHAEELRPRIVSHSGRITIEVRRDDFVKGSPENPWAEVMHEFSEQIRAHVGEGIHLFLPCFSTTGQVERAAAEIVLLDAMRSYFNCHVNSYCGIPAITLEGTPEDWKSLVDRVQSFRELGLGLWIDVLSPILDQFTLASQGDVDLKFWQSIYKYNSVSGGDRINGWITAFFPYVNPFLGGHPTIPSLTLLGNDQEEIEGLLYPSKEPERDTPGFSSASFTSGLSKASFRWNYHDQFLDMEFLSGFVGVAQDQLTLTLRPEIGWAVRKGPIIN